MHRAVALALSLAGCGRLFDLEPPVHEPPDDAPLADLSAPDVVVDTVTDAVPDAQLPAICPNTYTAIGNSKYRLGTVNRPWDQAQQECLADQVANSSLHTHLIVVTTQQEMNNLNTFTANETWTGLSDRRTDGTFLWVTAEATTYPPATGAPWGNGEPQVSTTENCVVISGAGELRVVSCGVQRDYVCECDPYPADPARY